MTTTNVYFTSGTSANRLDKTIDVEITRTNAYTYLSNGLVQTHTDERGLARTFTYDNLERVTGSSYPDGTTTSNRYTALDVTAIKDRLNYWTYFGFDSIRRKIAQTNANNVITRFGYCDCGGLSYITNAFGTSLQTVTTYNYDYQGNRISTIYPDGTSSTNWFDALGRPIVTGDAIGLRWLGYNNQGLLTVTTNNYGIERRTVFDIEDQEYSVTDANGVSITNTYDNLGRLRTRTYPDGGVEAFGYTLNVAGTTRYTNQLGKVWTYAYDPGARKTNEVGVGVYTNSFTYGPGGELRTLTDGKAQLTTWLYDLYGRVTNKVDQASISILSYAYDANSRLTNRWSKAKLYTAYSYDAVGNLILIDNSYSPDVTLQYDALDRLTNAVDAAGTTKYTYTSNGQVLTEDGPWTSDTVTYLYNNARRRSGLTLQQPTGNWTNGFTYDAAHRLSTVAFSGGTFTYTYKGFGNLVTNLALPNTAKITNAYDSVARLTGTYLVNNGGSVLNKHEYLSNAGNQRIRHTRIDGSYYTNTFDTIGQLTWADSSVGTEDRGYLYDAAFNLKARTNNGAATTFTVDAKNQLTGGPSSPYTYDANGNLTVAGSVAYGYDDENQLTSVTTPGSACTVWTYDARARRRKQQEYTWTSGSGSTALASSVTLGTLRSNFSGWVGFRFAVGGAPITVTQLGRWVVSGNSGSHTVKLVDSGGNDVPGGSVTVNTSGAAAGQFAYATLANSVTLSPGATYVWMSQETNGGDQWYDYNRGVTLTSAATPNQAAWANNGGIYVTTGASTNSYGPVNLKYTTGTWTLGSEVRYVYDGMRVIQERDPKRITTPSALNVYHIFIIDILEPSGETSLRWLGRCESNWPEGHGAFFRTPTWETAAEGTRFVGRSVEYTAVAHSGSSGLLGRRCYGQCRLQLLGKARSRPPRISPGGVALGSGLGTGADAQSRSHAWPT